MAMAVIILAYRLGKEAKDMKPDYFFILPWHFNHNILEREKEDIETRWKIYFSITRN